MKVHIASGRFVLLEFEEKEEAAPLEAEAAVKDALRDRGLPDWPSVEAECFAGERGTLVFAAPVRVLIPGFLARILEGE